MFSEKAKYTQETQALERKIRSKQDCQNSQDLFNHEGKIHYSFPTWFGNDWTMVLQQLSEGKATAPISGGRNAHLN